MSNDRVQTLLPIGALLALSAAITSWYAFLEPNKYYSVFVIFLAIIIGWEAAQRSSYHYAKSYVLFLLAVAALYAQQRGLSLLLLVPMIAFSCMLTSFLFEQVEPSGLNVRDQIIVSVAFTEACMLVFGIGIGIFLKGAIIMTCAISIVEVLRYSTRERWRAAAPYGMLTLLLLGLLVITSLLTH
jgi:hypothetical protein